MTLDDIVNRLEDKNLKVVADRLDIAYHRLYRLAKGRARRPLLEDIEKLKTYFDQN